jgi:hypothetical protein
MKAQSATEYLMTYGWAILIIIIVTAALYALGIFNPQTYIDGSLIPPDSIFTKTNKTFVNESSHPIFIPGPNQVRDICKRLGYDSGWVSQICGENEIQCFKEIGDASYYKCKFVGGL